MTHPPPTVSKQTSILDLKASILDLKDVWTDGNVMDESKGP